VNEERPVWLLDVDGVLNACSSRGCRSVWPQECWHRHLVADSAGRKWPILVADPIVSYLRAVHANGDAEIRWHTSWQHSAPQRLAPALGLPDWAVAVAPEHHDPAEHTAHGWWKLAAAARVLDEEGRRLVWTDDDISFGTQLLGSRVAELLRRPGVLAITPRTTIGLTRKNLLAVDEFLGTDHEPTPELESSALDSSALEPSAVPGPGVQ